MDSYRSRGAHEHRPAASLPFEVHRLSVEECLGRDLLAVL
jgi:hypothetical protein